MSVCLPLSFSVGLYLCLCLSLYLCLCLSLSVYVSLSLSLSVCRSLSLSIGVCVCLSLSPGFCFNAVSCRFAIVRPLAYVHRWLNPVLSRALVHQIIDILRSATEDISFVQRILRSSSKKDLATWNLLHSILGYRVSPFNPLMWVDFLVLLHQVNWLIPK